MMYEPAYYQTSTLELLQAIRWIIVLDSVLQPISPVIILIPSLLELFDIHTEKSTSIRHSQSLLVWPRLPRF